ncbi:MULTISPECIES: hypothetical protein [Komagataeibacter]|uniref:Uncharacterized protein n=2 Tax=Komagataeibacter TaxID=1434011 RepID=A0A857FPU2_KOMXY|nr:MULTISPECIES: hypothetical protein [Komagataeibacter]MBV1831017.1 hypothetical protein [Komagataeibacter melomenusus]NPC66953.1 hypothetical protein [Komagataeibacter melomenusus]QHC35220.1 hypothetical protein FMA36_06640 [Komagataeibacter xylinus]
MNRRNPIWPTTISPVRIGLCVVGLTLVLVQFIHGLNISPDAMPGQVMFHIAMLALGAIVFVAGMWGPSL